jgi:glycine C-acetyltransferase
MVDDCHAAGFIGDTGRGTPEYNKVMGKIDIITGTLGKALGGAMGGFTTGKQEIIDMLRQRSRPYLFSNSLTPAVVGASIEVFNLLSASTDLRDKLMKNANYFRNKMKAAGFDLKPSESAIVALMLYDARLSQDFAAKLLDEGIYVIGFYFPVVAKGQARIRIQISAAHSTEQLDFAVEKFIKIGKELGVI